MKKVSLLAAIAAVALAAGCSKEDVLDTENVGTQDACGLTEFGAKLPETSRTNLGGGDGLSVVWSKNDAISVWSDTEPEHRTFNIDEEKTGVGTASASFKINPYGSKGVVGNVYYAVYPANNSTEATVTLPSVQRYSADRNFNTNLNPMAAKVNDDGSDPIALQFHNLCGVIVVNLYTDDPDRANEKITQIELTSQTGNLCGTGTVDFSGDIPVATFDNGSRSLTFDCSANPQTLSTDKNNPNQFYIVVPAGDYNFLRITCYIASEENAVRSVVRRASLKVQPGMITRIGANVNVLPEPAKSYEIGDLYPDATNPQGVVIAVDADSNGTTGKMIALKDCGSALAWGPTETAAVLGLTDADDGSVNMAGVVKANALAQYPAFEACRALGAEWYLPAQNEMNTINGKYNDIQRILRATTGAEAIDDNADYWTSTVTGGGRGGYSIYYLGTDGIMSVKTASQGTKAVRAIAKFDSNSKK